MNIKNNRTGKLIKDRRESLGLTQQEMSKMLGFECRNAQVVSNIERLKCGVPPKHIVRLADVLHISSDQIIEAMTIDYRESLLNECNKQDGKLEHSKN